MRSEAGGRVKKECGKEAVLVEHLSCIVLIEYNSFPLDESSILLNLPRTLRLNELALSNRKDVLE